MPSNRCLSCGWANSGEGVTCESCGRELLDRPAYERRLQELSDYRDLRRLYGVGSILVAILLLLVSCALMKWFAGVIFPESDPSAGAALARTYAAPLAVAVIFLSVVLPLLVRRRSIVRRYRWSKEQMRTLKAGTQALPAEVFEAPAPADSETQKAKGPPVGLLVVVFGLLALLVIDQQAGPGLKEAIVGIVDPSSAATVSGEYRRHYSEQDLGGGVARSEQTWSYVFYPDGSYITYVDGYQQYGGSWSQSGNVLSITIPPIPGMTTDPNTFKATVSPDGGSFTVGEETYTRVD